MVSSARQEAYRILMRVEEGAYASTLLAGTKLIRPEERRLAQEIVLGVLRNYRLIDHHLATVSARDLERLDVEVRQVLRIGAYQLLYLSRIPPSAVVNESVKLVKFCRKASASGLVNAVLRRLAEYRDSLSEPAEPALRYSHPDWLYANWVDSWGAKWVEALVAANNETPPVTFRFNSLHPEVESGRKVLEGLYEAGSLRPQACKLLETSPREPLLSLASQGICYIQDEASQFIAALLGARPGEDVLDLCAAPGGKTTALAAETNNSGRLIACELHPARAKLLAETARRMRAKVEVVCCDAVLELPFNMSFDRILVDAPCSGTGTLRRNPEIRVRLHPEKLKELSDLQYKILSNAANYLKPGGYMVYSTCSVEPVEDEQVAERFLSSHPEFELSPHRYSEPSGFLRFWPHRDGTDGFFAAILHKKR